MPGGVVQVAVLTSRQLRRPSAVRRSCRWFRTQWTRPDVRTSGYLFSKRRRAKGL